MPIVPPLRNTSGFKKKKKLEGPNCVWNVSFSQIIVEVYDQKPGQEIIGSRK